MNKQPTQDLIGVVVDNADPLHLHRLRIRVSEWHTDVSDTQLPWFLPHGLDGWGATAAGGSFGPPLIGSTMWVSLHQGDPHSPIYLGYVRNIDNIIAVGAVNSPHRVGFNTGSSDYFYLDRQTGEVKFVHRTGTTFVIDGATGRVTVTSVEKTVVNSIGDVEITCPTLKLTGNFAATGASFTHNSVNVGSTHVHGGIAGGPSDTAVPH
jgi:hypothetical protein